MHLFPIRPAFTFLLFLILPLNAYAWQEEGSAEAVIISEELLDEGSIQVDIPMRHYAGDVEGAHLPDFDDSEWDTMDTVWVFRSELPDDWDYIRWFRFRLDADSSVIGTPISLTHNGFGAREIWYNGRLLDQVGVVSNNPDLFEMGKLRGWTVFTLDPGDEHIFAVRSAFTDYLDYARFDIQTGITLAFNQPERSSEFYQEAYRFSSSVMWFMIGLTVLFSVLHLFFYLYNRKHSFNLWFSLACLLFAAGAWAQGQWAFNETLATLMVYQGVFQSSMLLTFLCMAFFLRSVLQLGYPLYLKIAAAAIVLLSVLNLFKLIPNFIILISALLIPIEIFIAAFLGIRKQRKRAWFVSGAMAAFVLSVYLVIGLEILGFTGELSELSVFHIPFAGFIVTMVAMSIFQSRHLAELDLEHERISVELEKAREMQLSLIPKKLPEHTGYTISAAMYTAAEVGGDYYDYITTQGGMIWAFGDATGHGTEAGLVAAMSKTLFLTHANKLKPVACLREMSLGLKNTGVRQKFMCMGLLTMNHDRVNWCAAGMPPAVILRSNSGENLDILESKGMPLGSVTSFDYQTIETTLQPGDTVVLMSDGFPEQMDENREQFGEGRLYELLRRYRDLMPDEIIRELKAEVDRWRGSSPLHDDMSIVCMRKE